jgi:hypothetical protein
MKEFDIKKNTGLLIEELKPEDYVLGANSPIVFEARNSIADWRQFRSRDERQSYRYFDAMDCVTMSAMNDWEEQANWMLINNLWPEDALKFWNKHGYIVDGKFEVSDRFIAKLSGTTGRGNTFTRVHEAIRKCGVVPEAMWPASEDFTWETFYSDIREEVKALGLESLKYFNWQYEMIVNPTKKVLMEQLKHAPIHIGVGTCPDWSDGQVASCVMTQNHGVLLDAIQGGGYVIFDHYNPFNKVLAPDYVIGSACKAVLYPVKRVEPVGMTVFTKDIKKGESGPDVQKLKHALWKLAWMSMDDIVASDKYDDRTASAVFSFQLGNMLHTPSTLSELLLLRGKVVGPKTRAVLNQYYNRWSK